MLNTLSILKRIFLSHLLLHICVFIFDVFKFVVCLFLCKKVIFFQLYKFNSKTQRVYFIYFCSIFVSYFFGILFVWPYYNI